MRGKDSDRSMICFSKGSASGPEESNIEQWLAENGTVNFSIIASDSTLHLIMNK